MTVRGGTCLNDALLVVVAVLLAALLPAVAASPARASAPTCASQGSDNTDLNGLVGSAQPVILVHGWADIPMQETREALEALPSHARRQYLLFDYSRYNTLWPSDARVAACLAAYIRQVSDTHRARGGNGRVYLVAHSMGGIAIRFALDPAYGGITALPASVGGVVTLDTPHTGATWGDSFVAYVLSNKAEIEGGRIPELLRVALPAPGSRAWKCLAGGPVATFDGCEAPPEVPASVQMRQLVGEVSVRRTLFGVEAYTMNFAGDVIVPSTSQWGGGSDFRMVSCTAHGIDLAAGFWTLINQDNTALDIFSGVLKADVDSAFNALEPILQGLMGSGCSHSQMPTNGKAVTLVDEALDEQASNGGVNLRQLRGPAAVPASCGHPATLVRNGTRDFGIDGYASLTLRRNDFQAGPVFADLTGDGLREGAVVFGCSAGGVSWPDSLLIYTNGPELVAAFSLSEQPSTQMHATISRLELRGSTIQLHWTSYEGAGFNPRYLTGTVRLGGGVFRLFDVRPDPARFAIGPGTFGDLTVGASALDLAEEGRVVPSDIESCDQKWELEMPDGIWADFRDLDPDALDYVGVGWNAPQKTIAMVHTAEGVGVGTNVTDLREIYGDSLSLLTDLPAEGDPYDAYVLFGARGALTFAVDPGSFDGDFDDTVRAMFAVQGTDTDSLRTVSGGC